MQEPIKNFVRTYLDFNYSLFFLKSKKLLKKYQEFFDEEIVSKPLTYRQRISAILNEKRNLIVAGAGTGKTTTILAKVLYLIKSKECEEEEILLLAFTNSAKKELEERIEKKSKGKVKVSTIHALGREILFEVSGQYPNITPITSNNDRLNSFISNKLKQISPDSELHSLLVQYFSEFLVPEKTEMDFEKPDQYLTWRNMSSLITLNEDWVKGFGELRIGNFLYIYGIEHSYEEDYQHSKADQLYYRPDFYIVGTNTYIEYFGIDKHGNTAPWIDSDKYLAEIEWKRKIHDENGTNLIELTYQDLLDKTLFKKLKSNLNKFNVKGKKRSNYEIFEQVKKIRDGKSFSKFSSLIAQFLTLFKSKSLDIDDLIESVDEDKRTLTFLKIFKYIFLEYQSQLKKDKAIDFMDMLNESTNLIKLNKYAPNWKYIIVDEFQDTSYAQYQFINNILAKNEETKLFCVGDDWQSIYGFSGSDYHYMTDYKEYFGVANFWSKITGKKQEATLISLDETFRFNNMISHTSGEFIKKNPAQIRKTLKTPEHLFTEEKSVFLHWVNGDFEKTIDQWLDNYSSKKYFKKKNLLILSRYNFEIKGLTKNFRDVISKKWEKNGKVSYKTCHGSKGTEDDVVLIINVTADFLGFPSNVEDDPVLNLVKTVKENEYYHAEERRLFYVAMTRARYQTHILCDVIKPSIFANEIQEEEYKTVVTKNDSGLILCPQCKLGYLINKTQDRRKRPFYQCSRADVCDYVGLNCECGGVLTRNDHTVNCSNELCSKEKMICDKCEDGILIKRESKNKAYTSFYGCSNYQKKGCLNKKELN